MKHHNPMSSTAASGASVTQPHKFEWLSCGYQRLYETGMYKGGTTITLKLAKICQLVQKLLEGWI